MYHQPKQSSTFAASMHLHAPLLTQQRSKMNQTKTVPASRLPSTLDTLD